MPTLPKALDNMSKNLTQEERELREQAEEGVLPDRGREPNLERPALMTKNPAAAPRAGSSAYSRSSAENHKYQDP